MCAGGKKEMGEEREERCAPVERRRRREATAAEKGREGSSRWGGVKGGHRFEIKGVASGEKRSFAVWFGSRHSVKNVCRVFWI